jgi:hypothetical protein
MGVYARLTGVVVLGAVILATTVVAVKSHQAGKGWDYPWECCSDRDCWQMTTLTEPEPTPTPTGWKLRDGTIVPFAQVRPSPDGDWHVCRRGGTLSGEVITPSGGKTCLWAPGGV